jgi:hypothetical protein
MNLITETRKIKTDLGIANKIIPGLYITPSEKWQLDIINEMMDQIKAMCKVNDIIIVPNHLCVDENFINDHINVFMSSSSDKPLIKIF